MLAIPLAFVVGYVTGGGVHEQRKSKAYVSDVRSSPESMQLAKRVPTDADGIRGRTEQDGDTVKENAQESLGARVGSAWRTGSELQRKRAFLSILDEMKAETAPLVFQTLVELSQQGIIHRPEWAHFWMRWGELDGAIAMDTFLKAPKKWGDVGQIMWGWGEVNAEHATAWLQSHQEIEDVDTAIVGITHGHGARNLSDATSMALRVTAGGDPLINRLMEALAEQALRQGTADGVLAWFDTLPADGKSPEARAAAMRHVYSRLGQVDREQVMVWVQKQSSSPWRSDGIINDLATRIAQDQPVKALEWLQSLSPKPNGTYTGVGEAVSAWTKKDSAGLQQWLESAAPGNFRDQAVAALVPDLAKSQPRR